MSANTSFAHLVGSVPLADSETVFRAVSGTLGPHLLRIPDGETGERIRWIWFQREMLMNHPDLEIDADAGLFAVYQWDGVLLRESPYLRFKPSVDPAEVQFPTGYADAATASYDTFSRLRGFATRESLARAYSSRSHFPLPWRPGTCTSAPLPAMPTSRFTSAL